MTDTMDKATLISMIQTARTEFDMALAQVRPERMIQPGVSGDMSVKDIIAHVAWYEREMIGVLQQRALIGSDLWYVSLDERNAAILQANCERPLDEVRAEAQAIFMQLMTALDTLADAELNDARAFAQMPAEWVPWQVIASNTYEHYPQHIPDILAWSAQS